MVLVAGKAASTCVPRAWGHGSFSCFSVSRARILFGWPDVPCRQTTSRARAPRWRAGRWRCRPLTAWRRWAAGRQPRGRALVAWRAGGAAIRRLLLLCLCLLTLHLSRQRLMSPHPWSVALLRQLMYMHAHGTQCCAAAAATSAEAQLRVPPCHMCAGPAAAALQRPGHTAAREAHTAAGVQRGAGLPAGNREGGGCCCNCFPLQSSISAVVWHVGCSNLCCPPACCNAPWHSTLVSAQLIPVHRSCSITHAPHHSSTYPVPPP